MILESAYNIRVFKDREINKIINDPKIKLLGKYFECFHAITLDHKELIFIKLPNKNLIKEINFIKSLEYFNKHCNLRGNTSNFIKYMGILNKDNCSYLAFKKPKYNLFDVIDNPKTNKEARLKLVEQSIDILIYLGKSYKFNFFFDKQLFLISKKNKLKFLFLGMSWISNNPETNSINEIINAYFDQERKNETIISSNIKKQLEINYKFTLRVLADILIRITISHLKEPELSEIYKIAKNICDSDNFNHSYFYSIFSLKKIKNYISENLYKSGFKKLNSGSKYKGICHDNSVENRDILINRNYTISYFNGSKNVEESNVKQNLDQEMTQLKGFKIYSPNEVFFDIEYNNKKQNEVNKTKLSNENERLSFMLVHFFKDEYENHVPRFKNEYNIRDNVVPNHFINKLFQNKENDNDLKFENMVIDDEICNKNSQMKKIWSSQIFSDEQSNYFS